MAVFLPLLYCPNIFLKKSEKDLKTTPISKWANSKKKKNKKKQVGHLKNIAMTFIYLLKSYHSCPTNFTIMLPIIT